MVKKLTYYVCRSLTDHNCYSIRAATKKEATKLRNEGGGSAQYCKPVKVVVQYENAFSLLKEALGEGSIYEPLCEGCESCEPSE